jgi:peroxiredoxin
LAAFEEKKGELAELGVSVYAASVDSEEKSAEVAGSGITFPLGWGVSREIGDRLGSWWDERRDYIQPSEFVIRQDGRILQSSYSSGPLARTHPDDVLSMIKFLKARAEQKKG